MNIFSPLPIWQIVSVETMVFFVCFNKQIQDYLCFTVFFLQQPAIYAVLLLQGIFLISDFPAQRHTFLYIIIQNMYKYR